MTPRGSVFQGCKCEPYEDNYKYLKYIEWEDDNDNDNDNDNVPQTFQVSVSWYGLAVKWSWLTNHYYAKYFIATALV